MREPAFLPTYPVEMRVWIKAQNAQEAANKAHDIAGKILNHDPDTVRGVDALKVEYP